MRSGRPRSVPVVDSIRFCVSRQPDGIYDRDSQGRHPGQIAAAILESTGETYVDLATRRQREAELSHNADSTIIASDQAIPPPHECR